MGTSSAFLPDNERFEATCTYIRQFDPMVCLHLEWGRHGISIHLPSLDKAEDLAEAILKAVNKLGDEGLIKVLPPVPSEPLPF